MILGACACACAGFGCRVDNGMPGFSAVVPGRVIAGGWVGWVGVAVLKRDAVESRLAL